MKLWSVGAVVHSLESVLELLDEDRPQDAAIVVRAVLEELRAQAFDDQLRELERSR